MNEYFALYCSQSPGCICEKCLYHWSCRCPYGNCYDDLRAKENPYDKAHPDKPPRTYWSNWKDDQAYWCRGGSFYQAYECEHFVEYDRSKSVVKDCLDAVVQIYQDGYIQCSLVETVGCEECMKRFEEKINKREGEELAKKQGQTVQELLDIEIIELQNSFARWEHINQNGGQDPFYADGCNMNLVLNHICNYKRRIETICKESNLDLPEIYHRETPPEVDQDYIARHEEIPVNAKNTLTVYQSNEDYRYLLSVVDNLNKKQKESTCICNVINYVTGLEKAIAENDLIYMRRHENPEHYISSFTGCAEKVRALDVGSTEEIHDKTCESCVYGIDFGESVEYIECQEGKKNKDVRKNQAACDNYISCDSELDDDPEGDLEEQLEELLKEGDKKAVESNKYEKKNEFNCKQHEECKHFALDGSVLTGFCKIKNDRVIRSNMACENFEGKEQGEDELRDDCRTCSFSKEINNEKITCSEHPKKGEFKPVDDCPNYTPELSHSIPISYHDALEAFDNDELDEDFEPIQEDPPKKKPRNIVDGVCEEMREDCSCFCKHNDGCAALLVNGDALKDVITKHVIDCDVYRAVRQRVFGTDTKELDAVIEQPEIENRTTEIVTKESENVNAFDYSTVDEETAGFLQDKAQKINRIKMEAKLKLAVELEETFAKFAKLPYGNRTELFNQWVDSVGISPRTARNYIDGLEWVRANFPSIEDAMDIQPSLLFAASAKNAPQELQEGVKSGDITTHKQYKDLEAKLKEAEEKADYEAKRAQNNYNAYEDATNKAKKLKNEIESTKDEHHKSVQKLQDLTQQLEQAKRNGDPAKVKELGEKISGYQQEIGNYQEEIGRLNLQLQEKDKQLHEKPIEAQASKVVEVEKPLSDSEKYSILWRAYGTFLSAKSITAKEIAVISEVADFTKKESIIEFLENIRDMIPGYLNTLKGNVQSHSTCDGCQHASWEDLKEEDEAGGKIFCTCKGNQLVTSTGCSSYLEY